ncbi:hypothetical protein KAU55_00300 [Candidatus Bathyarchaeota archaeon]|nr:hypothetical protein [Candidatus Bathyarchaeota archaeon]
MKRGKFEELSKSDKRILNDLLQWPQAPQDKIWLDINEDRLTKLGQRRYVKKIGNVWALTEFGRMCAVIQERDFR